LVCPPSVNSDPAYCEESAYRLEPDFIAEPVRLLGTWDSLRYRVTLDSEGQSVLKAVDLDLKKLKPVPITGPNGRRKFSVVTIP